MSQWNSEQYLKFVRQRTQPAFDLAQRITKKQPKNVLDIGCGPGNSTDVLKQMFPEADILGVDSSEDMIDRARETYPNVRFQMCDVTKDLHALANYDLIFSNACLQWIPNHPTFIPALMGKLNRGGTLAVQIPINGQEPLLKIMDEVVAEPRWNFPARQAEANKALAPEEYFDLLSAYADSFEIWETVYYHNMPSVEAMVEWIKGTRLRPYLNALEKETAAALESEILKRAKAVYTPQKNGEFIFKFRRLFWIANAPD